MIWCYTSDPDPEYRWEFCDLKKEISWMFVEIAAGEEIHDYVDVGEAKYGEGLTEIMSSSYVMRYDSSLVGQYIKTMEFHWDASVSHTVTFTHTVTTHHSSGPMTPC